MARRPKPFTLSEILALSDRAEAAGQLCLAFDLIAIAGRMDPRGPGNYDVEIKADVAFTTGLSRACKATRNPEPKGVLS
jgi:hypothetical protein